MMDLNRTFIEAKPDQNKDKDSSCTKNILDRIVKDKTAFEEPDKSESVSTASTSSIDYLGLTLPSELQETTSSASGKQEIDGERFSQKGICYSFNKTDRTITIKCNYQKQFAEDVMKAAKKEKDCLRMTIFRNGNVIGSIHPKILCNECYFVRKELEGRKVPCSILTMDAQPAATCDKVLDYLVSGVIKFKFSEVREMFELCTTLQSPNLSGIIELSLIGISIGDRQCLLETISLFGDPRISVSVFAKNSILDVTNAFLFSLIKKQNLDIMNISGFVNLMSFDRLNVADEIETFRLVLMKFKASSNAMPYADALINCVRFTGMSKDDVERIIRIVEVYADPFLTLVTHRFLPFYSGPSKIKRNSVSNSNVLPPRHNPTPSVTRAVARWEKSTFGKVLDFPSPKSSRKSKHGDTPLLDQRQKDLQLQSDSGMNVNEDDAVKNERVQKKSASSSKCFRFQQVTPAFVKKVRNKHGRKMSKLAKSARSKNLAKKRLSSRSSSATSRNPYRNIKQMKDRFLTAASLYDINRGPDVFDPSYSAEPRISSTNITKPVQSVPGERHLTYQHLIDNAENRRFSPESIHEINDYPSLATRASSANKRKRRGKTKPSIENCEAAGVKKGFGYAMLYNPKLKKNMPYPAVQTDNTASTVTSGYEPNQFPVDCGLSRTPAYGGSFNPALSSQDTSYGVYTKVDTRPKKTKKGKRSKKSLKSFNHKSY